MQLNSSIQSPVRHNGSTPGVDAICHFNEEEIVATAIHFGYTPAQFSDLRVKIRVAMVVDRRRQLSARAAAPVLLPPNPHWKSSVLPGPALWDVVVGSAVAVFIVLIAAWILS